MSLKSNLNKRWLGQSVEPSNYLSMKIKKTVIIAGYRCNNHCEFCYNDRKKRRLPEMSTSDIFREIYNARSRGGTYLELIGGESTMRHDLCDILSVAKAIGFKNISMTTNGRMFSYKRFAKKIIKSGLTDLVFSVHGHCAELHDSLTHVNGSFDQLRSGIRNVKQIGGCAIGSNTCIVKKNYTFLPEIGKFLYGIGFKNSEFIFVDPTKGFARSNFKSIVPKISLAAPYIHRCLDLAKINRISHWHVRYVPLCYFLNYQNQISETYEMKTFLPEHIAPDFKNFDVAQSRQSLGRIKPVKCKICSMYNICEGIWRKYYAVYGDKELKPTN